MRILILVQSLIASLLVFSHFSSAMFAQMTHLGSRNSTNLRFREYVRTCIGEEDISLFGERGAIGISG